MSVTFPSGVSPWLWYDAADSTMLRTNGSGVLTGWQNKGTGSSSIQLGTVTGSPTIDVLNGRSTVFFPLGSRFTTPSMTPPAKQFAMFAVFKTFQLRDGFMSMFITSTTIGHLSSYISNYGTSAFSVNGFVGTNTISASVTPASTVLNTPVLATIINSATSTANNYLGINGTQQTLGTTSTASSAATTASTYEMFLRPNTTEYTTGTMGEIIVIRDDITVTQRTQIEGYLAWKWGLQANLPAAHPFNVVNRVTPIKRNPQVFPTSINCYFTPLAGITSYTVTVTGTGSGTGTYPVPSSSSVFRLTGLTPGAIYTVTIYGTVSGVNTPVATYNNVQTCNRPGPPTNVNFNASNGTLNVTWEPPAPGDDGGSAIQGYVIRDTNRTKALTFGIGASSRQFTTTIPSGTYRFRIAAVNFAGHGTLVISPEFTF